MKESFKSILIFVSVIVAIGVFMAVILPMINKEWQKAKNRPVPPGDLSEDIDLAEIATARNRGIAYLENNFWTESAEIFEELATTLPEEILPARNLAIAREGGFNQLQEKQGVDAGEIQSASKAAKKAILKLRELEPDSQFSYRLEARIADSVRETDQVLELLKQASERDPEDASIWYEIYSTAKISRSEEDKQTAFNAIAKAYELAPGNMFVVLDYLLAQVEQQDATIAETLKAVRPLFVPFQDRIQQKTRVDVLEFIDNGIAAAESEDWAKVRSYIRPIVNISRPDDVVQSDLRKIQANSLEFVKDQFSGDVETQLVALASETHPKEEYEFSESGDIPDLDGEIHSLQVIDFDLDLNPDLLVLTESSFVILTRNQESGEWTVKKDFELDQSFDHFLIADLDHDADGLQTGELEKGQYRYTADLDVVLYGVNGLEILETKLASIGGDVSFEKIESEQYDELREVTRVVTGDLNNDGDLDLGVIADGQVSYWNNNSNFEFTQIDFLGDPPDGRAVDLIAVDWDRDIDQDLVTLLEDGTVGYFEGLRHGDFRWSVIDETTPSGAAKSLTIQDADRNGSWDLMIAGEAGIDVLQTRTLGSGEVNVIERKQVSSEETALAADTDFNLDGYRDLLVIQQGQPKLLSFASNRTDALLEETGSLNSVVAVDFDTDGDSDLVTLAGNKVAILENTTRGGHHWSDVAIIAALNKDNNSQSQRINHFGLGALIELRSGPNYQLQLVTEPGAVRFGLGEIEKADAIRVLWPNGIPENIVDPETDQLVWELQTLSGSCPYLYAWNGAAFSFVTDLCWAAPIGMRGPNGKIVPDRSWEYIKIPGKMLKPVDGEYRIQLTEELWEAAYFEKVELTAVDHPADHLVYTNEKVGPPSIAEHRLYSVKEKRYPISVLNQSGRDITKEVSQRDENYAVPFEKKMMQGYVEETHLDLDFGLKEKPKHLTLFLTGWVYPTDVGINRAIYENDQLAGPRPPSISVMNRDGNFVEVIGYCGFPGGKTKTIAIDLSDVFLSEDYRIRLSTSMELYWDEIFISTDPTNLETVSTKLEVLNADLHYRGVSTKYAGVNNGPERYAYNELPDLPAWNPMGGSFTRFGDVTSLLTETDHRMVAIGTGDEITIRFKVPDAPVREGWTRDFVLHSVGWDKDANLHTIYGQTVEPLPFVGMKSYPYGGDEIAPHPQDYLNEYQTRKFDPGEFRRAFLSKHLKSQTAVNN